MQGFASSSISEEIRNLLKIIDLRFWAVLTWVCDEIRIGFGLNIPRNNDVMAANPPDGGFVNHLVSWNSQIPAFLEPIRRMTWSFSLPILRSIVRLVLPVFSASSDEVIDGFSRIKAMI